MKFGRTFLAPTSFLSTGAVQQVTEIGESREWLSEKICDYWRITWVIAKSDYCHVSLHIWLSRFWYCSVWILTALLRLCCLPLMSLFYHPLTGWSVILIGSFSNFVTVISYCSVWTLTALSGLCCLPLMSLFYHPLTGWSVILIGSFSNSVTVISISTLYLFWERRYSVEAVWQYL